MARWDWYQATVHGLDVGVVVSALQRHHDLSDVVPDRGKNGYTHGAAIRRGEHTLARVWWGGNTGVHVIGTGEDAPAVREVLDGLPTMHPAQPTRVDACEDWKGDPTLFDRLSAALIGYAREHGISINQQGDWVRGEARTLYLGSKHSVTRLVLYEKGYEQGPGADLTWVRLEVRVRPAKWARDMVARWAPGEAFGASQWLCEALECIGWDHLQKQACGTVWRPSDEHRARAALVRQYGATLGRWMDEAGGLDAWWAEFQALAESLDKLEPTGHSGVSTDRETTSENRASRTRGTEGADHEQDTQAAQGHAAHAVGAGDCEAGRQEGPVRGQAAPGGTDSGGRVGAVRAQGGDLGDCAADARRGAMSDGHETVDTRADGGAGPAGLSGHGVSGGLGCGGAVGASIGEPV